MAFSQQSITDVDFKTKFRRQCRTWAQNSTQEKVVDLNNYGLELAKEMDTQIMPALAEARGIKYSGNFSNRVYIPKRDENAEVEKKDCFVKRWVTDPRKAFDTDLLEVGVFTAQQDTERQFREAQLFLAEQFLDLKGNLDQSNVVKRVEICTTRVMDKLMDFNPNDGTLRIAMKKNLTGYDIIDKDKLKRYFNKGVHLLDFIPNMDKLYGPYDKFVLAKEIKKDKILAAKLLTWQYTNPRGFLRKTVKLAISKFAKSSSEKMDGLEESESPKAELRDYVSAIVSSEKDRTDIIELINGVRDQDIFEVAKSVKEKVQNKHQQNLVELSALRSTAIANNQIELNDNRVQRGLVNVKNEHIINVNIDLFPKNEYSKYVSSNTKIKVNLNSQQAGLVNVDTLDIVNVQAKIGEGLLVKTLKDALRKLQD